MKIKSFIFRIDERYSAADEIKINLFLVGKEIKRMRIGMLEEEIPRWSILIFYGEKGETDAKTSVEEELIELNESENELYEILRKWRNDTAVKKGLSAYMILHNSTLMALAKYAPTNANALIDIKGIGLKKIEDYGEAVLDIIREFIHTQRD